MTDRHERSETRYLHDMLTAAAQTVLEQGLVDRFSIDFERDNETTGVTGKRIRGNHVNYTEVTFQVRFRGDVTIRSSEPTEAELLASNRVVHPAHFELERLLASGPLGPLAEVAEEVAQLRAAGESSARLVHVAIEKVQEVIGRG